MYAGSKRDQIERALKKGFDCVYYYAHRVELAKGYSAECFMLSSARHGFNLQPEEIDAAFELYEMVAVPNKRGLSPQVYFIYACVIKPLLSSEPGFRKKEIAGVYFKLYGRRLGWKQLERDVNGPPWS